MNRALISLLVMALAASSVQAQSSGKGQGQGMRGPGQGPRMQHMQQALGLSQEQVDQIRSIRQNGGGRDEIRAVLNEEQRATMDEHRAARQGQGGPGKRGNRQGRGHGHGAGQAPAQGDSSETGNG